MRGWQEEAGGRHRWGIVALLPALVLVLGAVPTPPSSVDAPATPMPPDVDPKVEAIVRPLGAAPSILTVEEPLIVELADHVGEVSDVSAQLVPSFGQVRAPVDLGRPAEIAVEVASGLWPDRAVTAMRFVLPGDAQLAGLYDVHVSWRTPDGSAQDVQRRAVDVVDEHPEDPRVVVIADTSVGDPRPIQEGVEDAAAGDPDSLVDKTSRTVGVTDGNGRWGALEQVIEEINLVRPDFVLVAGDLTFGVHPRAAPYEYEDAWRLFDRLEVPSFFSPGNHDLYAFDDYSGDDVHAMDGLEMWQVYFGPAYYSVDIGRDLHLVSLNTFDWEERMPFPPPDFPTRSGGQIRQQQFDWLHGDLASYRAANPRGAIVTLAHHDPSWIQARHPWPGANRLEARDLLAEYDVGVHFAGHTHEDRVARYHRGDIVQTSGRPHRGDPVGVLSYLRRDDTIDRSWSQDRLGRILRQPAHGPLFVTTTTAASGLKGEDWGLGGYWGWRLANLAESPQGGYDPNRFGYPATQEFLDEHAERPENWNPDHARFGLFSYPSYHLSSRTIEGNDGRSDRAVVDIVSELATDLRTTLRVVVTGSPQALEVEGGQVVRTRSDGEVTDVWVTTTVPDNGHRTITVTN